MKKLKDFVSKNGIVILVVLLFHYPVVNQIAYYAGSRNPQLWLWFTITFAFPGELIRYPSLITWLFPVSLALFLYLFGHFWHKDEIISFGLRLTGLVILWFTLMFSVPIDVLKFLHSFNF